MCLGVSYAFTYHRIWFSDRMGARDMSSYLLSMEDSTVDSKLSTILLYLFTIAYNLLVKNLFTTQCIICRIGYPVTSLGFSLCVVIFIRVTF